jgi:hypothetical protein
MENKIICIDFSKFNSNQELYSFVLTIPSLSDSNKKCWMEIDLKIIHKYWFSGYKLIAYKLVGSNVVKPINEFGDLMESITPVNDIETDVVLELDDILDKISRVGINNISKKEKDFLSKL